MSQRESRLKMYADAVDAAFADDAPDRPSVYDIAERVVTVADGEQSDVRASLAFWKRRAHEMEQDRNRLRELNSGAVSTRNRVTGGYSARSFNLGY